MCNETKRKYKYCFSWPDYKVQNTVWDCEGSDWITEDSDNMFYDIEKTNENK